ncbi:hypothetical protein Tco_0719321 [Tanacetum coccineum]
MCLWEWTGCPREVWDRYAWEGVSDTVGRSIASLFEIRVGITEEGEIVTYLRFIANFSKNCLEPISSLTERDQKIGRVKLRRVRTMSMTIQSSVKDKYWLLSVRRSSMSMTYRLHPVGQNEVIESLKYDRKKVKPRRVRAMAMIIQYGVRGMILTAQSEAFKQENVKAAMSKTFGLLQQPEILNYTRRFQDVKLAKIYIDETIARNGILFDCAELVLDMTDKVVLIKEKLKAARDRQKSYADNRRKPLEFEVGDRVMLKVSPWKGVIRFRKKGKLAPEVVGQLRFLK